MKPSRPFSRLLCVCVGLSSVLAACAETTLETPSEHPANSRGHSEALPSVATALAPGFDPFSAYPAPESASSAEPSHHHAEAAEPAQKTVIYTCPMHPEIRKEAPGNCPICGMRLVPKEPQTEPPTEPNAPAP